MYAAILLTSACSAGFQPPAAAAAPPAAAPIVVTAAPSSGCVGSTADCCQRASLLDRIRARLQAHHGHGCGGHDATPRCHAHREHHTWHAAKSCDTCAAPAPSCGPTCHAARGGHGHKASGCDSCPKASLLDRLKAHFSHNKSHGCDSCGTASYGGCTGCDAAPAPTPVPATGGAPVPMPMGEKK